MNPEALKNGHITYTTVIELTGNGSVMKRDETSHCGECKVGTDEEGRIVCVVFEDAAGTEESENNAVSNTLRIHEDRRVSFVRNGPISSEFIFDPENTTTARVDTPYGSMELELATRRAEIVSGPSGTDIFIEYVFREAPFDRHTITLRIGF